jgi:hypothetical protein
MYTKLRDDQKQYLVKINEGLYRIIVLVKAK